MADSKKQTPRFSCWIERSDAPTWRQLWFPRGFHVMCVRSLWITPVNHSDVRATETVRLRETPTDSRVTSSLLLLLTLRLPYSMFKNRLVLPGSNWGPVRLFASLNQREACCLTAGGSQQDTWVRKNSASLQLCLRIINGRGRHVGQRGRQIILFLLLSLLHLSA